MEEKIYIVTNPENGWDCINGAFKKIEGVKEYINSYTHLQVPEELKTLPQISHFLNNNESDLVIHLIKLQ